MKSMNTVVKNEPAVFYLKRKLSPTGEERLQWRMAEWPDSVMGNF